MQLNYLIIAHTNPEQYGRLVRKLNSPFSSFFVFIDGKADLEDFEDQTRHIGGISISYCRSRFEIGWGDFTLLQAILELMKAVVENGCEGYGILLSGMDYPLKSNEEIRRFFTDYNDKNFMELVPMKSKNNRDKHPNRVLLHWFHPYKENRTTIAIPSVFHLRFYTLKNFRRLRRLLASPDRCHWRRIFMLKKTPRKFRLYGGSTWWALPVRTIRYMLEYLHKRPELVDFARFTHCPDEFLLQSVLGNNSDTYPILPDLTYANWTRKDCQLPVTFRVSDFSELSNVEGRLFARKFDISKDSRILDMLDDFTVAIDA